MRANVRSRLRRPRPTIWLARGGTALATLAALLVFALIIGGQSGTTLGWVPDRLFLLQQEQLLELHTDDGTQRRAIAVDEPLAVQYDQQHNRLYVLTRTGVVAVDAETLAVVQQWDAPERLADAQLLLDTAGERLYVASPRQHRITQIDATSLTAIKVLLLPTTPDALAIALDGRFIYAYSTVDSTLHQINVQSERVEVYTPPQQIKGMRAWLATSANGKYVYLLASGASTTFGRFDVRMKGFESHTTKANGEPPWGLVSLPDGGMAVPRGNGQTGGVEVYDPNTLAVALHLDPGHDQHHLVAGPRNAIFAFQWNGTVTRYNLATLAPDWRVSLPERLLDGVFVGGGLHFGSQESSSKDEE